MTDAIGALPRDVVHLMAAGEVIDSLAAVVRELSENAIDAGATRIAVTVWGSQWRLRVADNGAGLSLLDLQQAALPHYTSKIKTCDDLWRIKSLGFRGEALHSLAQLSILDICSRPRAAEHGWQAHYGHDGVPVATQTVAIAAGTVVTVQDLFGNWPGRRQGLPSLPQQLRAVQLMVQKLALCHPQITWQMQQGDRPWFSISAGQSGCDILPQYLRDVQRSDLRDGQVGLANPEGADENAQREDPRLYVLLGLPDRCHRHRPDWVHVAVNGRIVQCPELEQIVVGAFRHTLPRDRYPVGFVHLTLPPEYVDWNRHPAKAELYLHHLSHWQAQLREAIAHLLNLQITNGDLIPQRTGQVFKSAEQSTRYLPGGNGQKPRSPVSLPLKAIAQVHQMYILAEHPTGLWLIEQHIAHERVLYEHLCDRWQMVDLEPPLILPQLSAAQVEQLECIGVKVDLFGDDLWAARTAPEPLAQRTDCADALLELSRGPDLDTALVATACRTAIRNGTPLDLQAMQTLIDQWQTTRHPQTCPHGRPIFLPLEESSLSRFFRRHWVIGKSHGI